MMSLGLALALVVGVTLGMLGGGGSILTVPIFVYVLGYDPKAAIAMSLPVVALTSCVGVLGHWRAGRVDMRMAVLFGLVAILGALAGTRLADLITGATQLVIFSIVMLASAVFMFRSSQVDDDARRAPGMRLLVLVPVGLGVGMLTGLVGVGGGFIIVPSLVLLARVPMKQAVGTSLLVIAINAFAAFVGYVGRVPMEWGVMALFTLLAIVGILTGSWLVRFVPQQTLKRAFAVLLLVMGGLILYNNRVAVEAALAHTSEAPDHAASTGL